MNPSNDPSLTAWALDQMSADERAAYEATLTQEPGLKTTADELKNFCQFISTHVRDQNSALTAEQRQKLMGSACPPSGQLSEKAMAASSKPVPKIWWKTPAIILSMGAAAALVLLTVQVQNPAKTIPAIVAAPPTADSFADVAGFKKEVPVPATLPMAVSQPAAESKIQQLASTESWKPLADARSDMETPVILGKEIDPLTRGRTLAENQGTLELSSGGTITAAPSRSLQAEMKPAAGSKLHSDAPETIGLNTLSAPAPLAKTKDINALSYTGGTVINGGVLAPVAPTPNFPNPALGTGGITKAGGGTITLAGKTDTFTTNEQVIGGTYQLRQQPLQPNDPTKRIVSTSSASGISLPESVPSISLGTVVTGVVTAGTTAVTVSAPTSPSVALVARKATAARSEGESVVGEKNPFVSGTAVPNEPSPVPSKEASRETYAPITENPLTETSQQPLSTFSIDVDTAAYANVRRFLNSGARPPADAVRLEELINYFPYDYEFPQRGEAPFTVAAAVAEAPWHPTHRLARIAIKARDVGMDRRQSNFVFLVDVSGSMNEPNKLPLVQQSLSLLTDQLAAGDRVAIVVYAGNSGLALSSTTGDQKETIREAIRQMKSGGSTHGSAGIRQAYEEAQKNFIKEGVNRVILCTDGDFNVGTTSPEDLEKLITEKAKDGVFLSVLGYGTGNTQDHTMETLADKGNGNYAYIDSLSEARKVLVDQMRGTLITVAKDVKIQVEFNPAVVQSYRLIGYENRLLAKEDFNNDAKDAGEIGAGHTVTALYEIVPVGVTAPDGRPVVDPLKYQSVPAAAPSEAAKTGEMMTVKLRFKKPDGDKSELIDFPVSDENQKLKDSEPEFRFATAVASFGLLLRDSSYRGDLTWEQVRQLALGAKGEDPNGYRGEFIQLIDKARGILGDGRP